MPQGTVQCSDVVLEAVLTQLEDVLGQPRQSFSIDDEIATKLGADSDDLSFYFIPRVQSALGIRVPNDEWAKVGTAREICEMLEPYYRMQRDATG